MDDAETSLSSASASPRGRLRVDVPSPLARRSSGYLASAGMPSHPQELDDDPRHRIVGCVWSRTGKTFPYAMHRGEERVEVQGHYSFSFDDGNAYLEAGLSGLGVLWLPEYMAKAHVARGELRPIFEDWRLDPMPMFVAFPPNRRVSAKLRVFIDWVVDLMAEHAPVSSRRGM